MADTTDDHAPGGDAQHPDDSIPGAASAQLMSIGRFSSLTRISVRMLHHYDAHGVLVPADVDPWSGYRRYSATQLPDAADIRNLRDVGFGVSAISALLASRGTETWTNALRLQRDALVDELRAAQGRLTLLTRLLDQGEPMSTQTPNPGAPSITVDRVSVPAMTVVTFRGTVPTYSDEGLLWHWMMRAIAQQGITPTGPCGVIEHDEEYTEHDVDLSIFLPVAPGTTAEAPLEVVDLPERDCVMARVLGPYSQLSTAHDLINERIAADGLSFRGDGTVAGKPFNLYLTTPDRVAQEDLITEVYEPLA